MTGRGLASSWDVTAPLHDGTETAYPADGRSGG